MIPITVYTLIISSAPEPSVVVLKPIEEVSQEGKSRIVPIWIGVNEATQIGISLEKARFSRPMTHDLCLDMLTNLDAKIDHIIINNVKGTTFFSQLVLSQHNRLITLDARPSDALALAIRQKAPLYIEEEVLEKASFPYIFKKEHDIDPDKELCDFQNFLKDITPEDFK